MAASYTRRPVTVTVGAAWSFHLDPRPHQYQNSLVTGIIALVVNVARFIFGVVYYRDCPQQPNIPIYLIGMALITLVGGPVMMYENSTTRTQVPPSFFKACLMFLTGLFVFTWILAGNVWVFSVYQPNYDPTAADGLYCNKTLYTFAFWNAVWETFSFWVIIARMCKGLLCGVTVRPAPTDGDFYGYV